MLIYIDDIVLTRNNEELIQGHIDKLSLKVILKDLSQLPFCV